MAKNTLATDMMLRIYNSDPDNMSEFWGVVTTGAEPSIPSDTLLRTLLVPVVDSNWLRDNWYDPVHNADELAGSFGLPHKAWGDTIEQTMLWTIAYVARL